MKLLFEKYDELREISTLKDSEFQRNIHPEEQIKVLAKIMKEEGVTHPIYVSKLSGNICFGHGRKAAALLNKWEQFPVVYVDFKDRDQEWRMVQSDNAIASWSQLKYSEINHDLAQMGPFDMDLLGIENFLVEPLEKYDIEAQEDLVKNVKKIICKHCGAEIEI